MYISVTFGFYIKREQKHLELVMLENSLFPNSMINLVYMYNVL